MQEDKTEVLVLFSGGMDSIAAAVLLARDFPRVRLLTCSAPYIMGCRLLTVSRVRNLQRNFPSVEFSQTFVDHSSLLHCLRPLNAVKEAGSSLIFCTACKLSMHLKAIEVCRREGLQYASSGIGVLDQQKYPDQLPALENRVNRLYAEAGIERLLPLAGYSKKEIRELLLPLGLLPRLMVPRCPVKYLQTLWWFYFGWPADKKILDWYDSKLPILESIINDGMR